MGRPRRIDVSGSWHHIMNRGAARRAVFLDDADRVEFGRLLGVINDRFGIAVHAYCLMTNHYHCLVQCPDGGLSTGLRDLGSTYTRHFNERHRRDGPLFRGRFHSVEVSTDEHMLCAVRYIHRNALALPSVSRVDEYRWSSHRTFLGHRRSPSWLETDAVLTHFGGDRAVFDAFVAGPGRAIRCPDSVDGLIQLAIADAVAASDQEDVAAPHLDRTVRILLADEIDRPLRSAVLGGLEDVSRYARRRAEQRLAGDPIAAQAVASARRLLLGDPHVVNRRADCA